MVWVVVVVVVLLALHFLGQKQENGWKRERLAKEATLSELSGFKPAATYISPSSKYLLAVAPDKGTFAISMPGLPAKEYAFVELIAVEIERDGSTLTQTKGRIDTKGAAVATALIGPLGMVAGAKTSSTAVTVTRMKTLNLKLIVEDFSDPVMTIPFLESGMSLSIDHKWVKEAQQQADEWYGRFRTILAMRADSRG